ncbi:SNF2 family helicase [Mycena kentingensis (nom. inval.)]|nr:SNF2 family helicase [Mycena kentingensis (nom. inval.)]
MARFRAYASDSSSDDEPLSDKQHPPEQPDYIDDDDDDDDDETEEDGEDEPSSPSTSSHSDLREEDLAPSRNALVQDEHGDFHYRNETAPRPWPQRVGIDAQKMHVMQTSFFRVAEEAAAMQADRAIVDDGRLRVPLSTLNRKHSRDSDGDGLRFEPAQRVSFAQDIDPPVFRPTRKYARVESSGSAVVGGESALVDAGLAFGRSFRVGWGPQGVLVHPGAICAPSASVTTSANSSTITRTFAPVAQSGAVSEKLLQHQLSHSPIDFDDDNVPFANPSSTDLHFSSFAGLFPSTDRSFEASLFRLGSALFDVLQLRLGDSVTPDVRAHVTALRRKAALSAWLEDAVSPSVEAEIRAKPSADPAAHAFIHLTGNQVERAADVTMHGGYLKLATLISQAGGDVEFREDLKMQLDIWRDQRVDLHVDENVRRIYALLAGVVDSTLQGSSAAGQEKCSDIDIVAGLDWKRVFGLYMWFAELVDAPISEVFHAYSESLQSSGRTIAGPVPWYMETSAPHTQARWKLKSPSAAPDALFSLIRLHADPACSLSQILSPLSFSPSPLDYSLPWHLYIILSRCMRVRDFADRGDTGARSKSVSSSQDGMEGSVVDGHSPSADLLTSSYAFQLEQQGMVQEAVFVLLHIEGSAGRAKVIKELLARNASRLDEWMTRGLVGSLRIPMSWVHEAKAIYALHSGKVYDAFELYCAAGMRDDAHTLAVNKLSPDVIIRNDLDLLSTMFSRFQGRPVNGWHARGKVLLDYANIVTRLPLLEDEIQHARTHDEISEKEEERDDLARGASKLVNLLPDVLEDRSDLRHNAALATMIEKLVALVDRVQPLAMGNALPTHVDESVKLQHLQSTLYSRFMDSIINAA